LLKAERNTGQWDVVYKPWFAESWDIAPDGKSITFKLRKGVKWAQLPPLNGREVTAEDVKYSYDRLAFDPRSSVRGAFISLASVEVVDKYTVKFVATAPTSLLIENARQHPAWIIPREVVERDGNIDNTMIGAGPYYLEKKVAGVGYTLARNPNYFDAPKPYPDTMKWILITDAAALTAAFRSGQLDVRSSLKKPEMEAILKTNPTAKVERVLQGETKWLIYKADEPGAPWADMRVRVATSKALERDAMLAAESQGEGVWGGIIHTSYAPYALTGEETRKIYNLQYDPAVAKQLMKEAGYPNGFKLPIATRSGDVPRLLLLQQMLKENLNIQLDFQIKEAADFIANGFTGNYKNAIMHQVGGTQTWFLILQFTFYSKGKWPTSKLGPVNDASIEDIFTTFDEKERVRKTRELQYRLLNDQLWYIPTIGSPSYNMFQPWLQDFNPQAIDNTYLTDAWVSK